MNKRIFALLLALALALAPFCLPVSAAPSQADMAKLTPHSLKAKAVAGGKPSASLTFKIDLPAESIPGTDDGGDIRLRLEFKRGSGGDWEQWVISYGFRQMMEYLHVGAGEFEMRFNWPYDDWDGRESFQFRLFCEYSKYGMGGTGIRSGYSNIASTKLENEPEPETTTTKPATTRPPRTTKPTAAPTVPKEPKTKKPKEPKQPKPARERRSFAMSRTAMLSIGIPLIVLLLLAAAVILLMVFKKDKRK